MPSTDVFAPSWSSGLGRSAIGVDRVGDSLRDCGPRRSAKPAAGLILLLLNGPPRPARRLVQNRAACRSLRAGMRRWTGADMTVLIPESVAAWLVDRSSPAVMGNTMPPRNPNDDEDDEGEDGPERDDDLEPAEIREPDE
jgi:hypothetical protein